MRRSYCRSRFLEPRGARTKQRFGTEFKRFAWQRWPLRAGQRWKSTCLPSSNLLLDGIQVLHIVDHLVEGRTKIVEFYVSRIRPELRAAVEAWIALKPLENPNTPAHPLVMPEYTRRVLDPSRTEVHRLEEDAEHQLRMANVANQTSDRYVLFTVLLASVLFFTGIAGKFDLGKARATLLVFAAIVLASVAVLLFATPVARA